MILFHEGCTMNVLMLGLVLLLAVSRSAASPSADERAARIVARDGSGDFRTIQEAINSIPATNDQNVIILM